MRRFFGSLALLCTLHSTAQHKVPDSTWACQLTGPRDCPGAGVPIGYDQARLSPRQSVAISRFVQKQFERDPQRWEATPHGDRVCPADAVVSDDNPSSLQCLDIRTLPSSPDIFWVSAQRDMSNPVCWILRVSGTHAVELAPCAGTPEVLSSIHNGFHDIVMIMGGGASHTSLAYLRFNGTRYRMLESHNFTTCGELPGHSRDDQRRCFEDGRPVGGS